MKLLRCTAALLALSLGQSAFAATFSFTGLGSVSSSGYSATNDGVTVTVTTPGANDLAYSSGGFLSGAGLGSSGGFFDSSALGSGESLLVSFSESVVVDSLSLGSWGFGDSATVSSSGGDLNLSAGLLGGSSDFDLSSLGSIASFTLSASGLTPSFYLTGVSVTGGAAVPVPAAAWLFMSALVGLVGRKRLAR